MRHKNLHFRMPSEFNHISWIVVVGAIYEVRNAHLNNHNARILGHFFYFLTRPRITTVDHTEATSWIACIHGGPSQAYGSLGISQISNLSHSDVLILHGPRLLLFLSHYRLPWKSYSAKLTQYIVSSEPTMDRQWTLLPIDGSHLVSVE